MNTKQFTLENITELKENEIFVFGSNLNGNHAGGAARLAVEKFGAIQGQAEGLQGQSYAIPTLDKEMQKIGIEDIGKYIDTLISFAKSSHKLSFFVTKIGCGIAGFEVSEIAPIFKQKNFPVNIILPKEFCVTKGYKAFNEDLSCRGYKYEIGKTYEQDNAPRACDTGFHFCEKLVDCFEYYPYDKKKTRVAEIECIGMTHTDDGKKYATNQIKILKEIDWEQVDGIVNIGVGNSGFGNSGDLNSGYRNSGDLNSGYRNSGVFCTRKREDTVPFFNKESNMSWDEWYNHPAYRTSCNLTITEWISWNNMTDDEKKEHPKAFVPEGYVKVYEYKEAWANLWKELSTKGKDSFKTLPNFESAIFEDITGIKI